MPVPKGLKAIDVLVRKNPPRAAVPNRNAVDYLFTGLAERSAEGATIDEMAAEMDEAGIEKGILSINPADPEDIALRGVQKHPDKFVPYVMISPHEGMNGVRKLETWVKQYNVKALHIFPAMEQLPHNDKRMYPLYAKCIELDLPVTMNVGIPGPRVPGWVQDPMYLDEVCWFFPELKVVMTHGGEPWQFTCVKLMLKWPNLYYMTSAFSPRYYPKEIIDYMNTRGADKVMFATGYPLIDFRRAMSEIKELPLRDHVWSKFLRENAIKVFKL